MTYQFTPLVVPFIVNGCVAIIFALFGWSRRLNPGGKAFALLMLAIGEWSLCRSLEASAVGIPGKVFWAQVSYLGISTAGMLWLLFAAEFARKGHWFTKKRLVLLAVIPVVTIGMVFTNARHGLIWPAIIPHTVHGYSLPIFRHGPWFWVATAYNYTTFITGTVLLLRAFRYYTKTYHFQAVLIVIAAVLPMTGNALYLTGLSPLPGLDLTHFGFTGAALIFSLTVFRYKMFDLRQLARDIVIEGMDDGVVVVDEQSRIVDLNPAARRMFSTPAFLALGMSEEHAAVMWSGLTTGNPDDTRGGTEINLGERTYRINVSPLAGEKGRPVGRVLFMVDVTEQERAWEVVRSSEERFRDLFENAPCAYFSLTADGIIQQCNGRTAELLGAPRDLLTGRSIFVFSPDTENDQRAAHKAYADAGAGGAVEDRRLQMQKADGTAVTVRVTVKAVHGAGGAVEGYRCLAVEVPGRGRTK